MKGPSECNNSPGRVKSGFSSCNANEVFADYVWMAEELEDFDMKVVGELWEESFIEMCFEEMLEEEEERETKYYSKDEDNEAMNHFLSYLKEVFQSNVNQVLKAPLNPLAAEFVPHPSSCVSYVQLDCDDSQER